jgi:hypothetical protein
MTFIPSNTVIPSSTGTHSTNRGTEARRRRRMAEHATLEFDGTAPTDRDRIAEKAMQSYLLQYGSKDYATVAEWAYKMADAMLLERKRWQRRTGQPA